MYHGRFSKSHYEAGYNWGSLLYKNGKNIDQSPAFRLTGERRMFAENCLPVYEKYYPEILEEIRGLADGQKNRYEDFYTFLLSMYCLPLIIIVLVLHLRIRIILFLAGIVILLLHWKSYI